MFEELLKSSKVVVQAVDTYLFFPENQLARAAVTRLKPSNDSTRPSSITVVYGPPGIGKTHLARWTLKEIIQRHRTFKFEYSSIENLCRMMQLADERQSLADLLEQFQSLDVLVCEGLDWLDHAPASQSWFVMLIETLEKGSTQVLVTSQQPVGEFRSLDLRLVSRFHGGLCVSMPMPGFESRLQLVQHWFREFALPILKPFAASAQFFSERLPVSPRELHQAVVDLAQRQSRHPAPIDVAYLERWLAKEKRTPRLSFESIVVQVAKEFGVEPSELRSRSRQQGLAVPRQCAMWLARELTGRPLDQIGDYFDRSHTTVSHSLSRLNELLPAIPSLRQQVQKLRKQLKELPLEDCA